MKKSLKSAIALFLCMLLLLPTVLTGCGETASPTAMQTEAPTDAPTEAPTDVPTEAPTDAPTEAPTDAPTEAPTDAPTEAPTIAPTEAPTVAPTEAPTVAPTEAPTVAPTEAPTVAPTEAPTVVPTEAPTDAPTDAPTNAPPEESTESFVDVQSVSLNQSACNLFIGASISLTADVLPANATNPALTWVSSNPSVATVANGVVTGMGEGTATVTVTTSNHLTASCTVTVEEELVESGLLFALTDDDSFYIVTGYYGNAKEYAIPTIHDGVRIIGIATGAFENNTRLQKITVPTNIESIGERAFAGCTSLSEISIPKSVTEIKDYTFYGCSALQKIQIHEDVTRIGAYAFAECASLENVDFEEGLQSIGNFAFDYCTSLQEISLPDSVTMVGNGAFRHAHALERVKLSAKMSAINNITFQYCESLKEISLHEGIASIGNSSFSFCYALEKLEILGDVTSFGDSAFYHCEKLKDIYFASSVPGNVGNKHYSFCRAGLAGEGITLTLSSDAVVPEGLFEPFENANRPKITKMILEAGIESANFFGEYNSFVYLQSVSIPRSLLSISAKAFFGCTSLEVIMEKDSEYTFVGWYDRPDFVGGSVSLTAYAGEWDLLYANWRQNQCSVSVSASLSSAGSVSGSGTYEYGSSVTVKATTNNGYAFVGWYEDGNKVSSNKNYTFTVTSHRALEARFEKNNVYIIKGNYIYFGEYPQSLKEDSVSITSTTDSRGYYLGSDGAYYAKVVADPYDSGYTFSTGETVTDGTTYYFKVEPIRWRILEEKDGEAFLLCDSIIANGAYDAGGSNNYANSDVRAWLNGTFYETAFSDLQKEIILTTLVDNSVASTGYSSNPYACADTEDKVFLLSYKEVRNSAYGFSNEAREMKTSDYSRATGAYMNTGSSYYGNGYWWPRSPVNYNSYNARIATYDGNVIDGSVDYTINGLVPALWIQLS